MIAELCKTNKLLKLLPFVKNRISKGATFDEAVCRAKKIFDEEYAKVRKMCQADNDPIYK